MLSQSSSNWLFTIALAVLAGQMTFASEPILVTDDQTAQQTQVKSGSETQSESVDSPDSATNREYEYKKFTNIRYVKTDNYSLLCDIYQPEGNGPFPAVLAIHGGAWRHGSKLQMLRHAWKMASAGYVVVAINYRHAPQYKFPAQVHDSKMAVRWMRQKKDKLKINPDQIAVFGYSAGGHLSAMLGTTDSKDNLEGTIPEELKPHSSRVGCVVVGGGPCEFSWIKSNALKDWLGDNQTDNPEIYLKAAPVSYATADDPPFLFFHGSDDKVVPPASSEKLHQRLLAVGASSSYRSVENKGHFATFSDTTWMDEAIKFMDESLNRKHHD